MFGSQSFSVLSFNNGTIVQKNNFYLTIDQKIMGLVDTASSSSIYRYMISICSLGRITSSSKTTDDCYSLITNGNIATQNGIIQKMYFEGYSTITSYLLLTWLMMISYDKSVNVSITILIIYWGQKISQSFRIVLLYSICVNVRIKKLLEQLL